MMNSFENILDQERPALLIGNGINHYNNKSSSSWEELLAELAQKHGLALTQEEASEMSNTEFFDILDLARPKEDRSSLQEGFYDLMDKWQPSDHHSEIVGSGLVRTRTSCAGSFSNVPVCTSYGLIGRRRPGS